MRVCKHIADIKKSLIQAMSQIRLTTTGTQNPVIVADLSATEFAHPTTNYILTDTASISTSPFTLEQIKNSVSLQTLIAAGHITLTDQSGNTITDVYALMFMLSATQA